MFFCNEDGEIAAREVVNAPSLETSQVRLVRALHSLILVLSPSGVGQGDLCRSLHPSLVCEQLCDKGCQPCLGVDKSLVLLALPLKVSLQDSFEALNPSKC